MTDTVDNAGITTLDTSGLKHLQLGRILTISIEEMPRFGNIKKVFDSSPLISAQSSIDAVATTRSPAKANVKFRNDPHSDKVNIITIKNNAAETKYTLFWISTRLIPIPIASSTVLNTRKEICLDPA
jgi:hypothetical protein